MSATFCRVSRKCSSRLQQCLSEVKQGEESSHFPVDGTYIHLNETIAKQRVGEER